MNEEWRHLVEHAKRKQSIFSLTVAQVQQSGSSRSKKRDYVDLRKIKPKYEEKTSQKRKKERPQKGPQKRIKPGMVDNSNYEEGKDRYDSDLGSASEDEIEALGIE